MQREKLDAHPLFERVSEEELEDDAAAQLLLQGTEEGQKVARNGGKTWRHVYRRVPGPSDSAEAVKAAGGQQQEQQQQQQQQQQEGATA
jgi:tRNA (guanine-N7-)-methyltransferase